MTSSRQAIAAGKHVYCEKPTAVSTESAYELYEVAKKAGVKNGVVQDKLWLPGLVIMLRLTTPTRIFGYAFLPSPHQLVPPRRRIPRRGVLRRAALCHAH